MKKILLLLLLNINSYVNAGSISSPLMYGVYDLKSNILLESKSRNELHSIASLTKLMTAHVFLKYYNDDINNCISSIEDNDKDIIKHTKTRIDKEKSISCESLLQLMLLASDNYAASAIARSIPGVSKEEFYKLMNKEANNIGMKNTFYKDSSGLSFENKSTTEDLIKLIKVLMQNEKIKNLSGIYAVNLIIGDKTILFKNSNKLIRDNLYSAEISKTGYISESGYNLIFVPKTECENKNIAIVLMGAKSSEHRANFTKKLLEKYQCEKNSNQKV